MSNTSLAAKSYALIDLHLHLDGSLPPSTVRELASMQGVSLPESDRELAERLQVDEDCKDLNEYLEKFFFVVSLLQRKDAIVTAAYHLAEELRQQGLLDGVIVVSHDDDLSRVAGKKLFVHDLTYAELMELDVGSWFDKSYSDLRLSTLDEVLKACKDNVFIQIEIKPSGFDVNLEENLLQVAYDNDMQDQVVFICLQPEPLRRIKELGSDIPTVYTMFFAWGHIEDVAFSDAFSIEERNITRTLVDNIHSAGKQVFVWTVNSESGVQYLVDCGVDGIVTDDPVMMQTP